MRGRLLISVYENAVLLEFQDESGHMTKVGELDPTEFEAITIFADESPKNLCFDVNPELNVRGRTEDVQSKTD
jgi:hypothetical protein